MGEWEKKKAESGQLQKVGGSFRVTTDWLLITNHCLLVTNLPARRGQYTKVCLWLHHRDVQCIRREFQVRSTVRRRGKAQR